MRNQEYDGAANMAGIHRGVQARIWQLVHGVFIELIYIRLSAYVIDTGL